MAKRLLRDWTASEKMDSLSSEAEVFFTRLIMKADDYGSYYANPKLLKAALYPLKEVTCQDIGRWVFECTEAGLIFPYEVDGREYIRINDFGQRLRQKKSTFPEPADIPPQVAADCSEVRLEEKRREVEVELADASLHLNGNPKVPREPLFSKDHFYQSGQQAFEEIKADELFVERLVRVVRNEGYIACDAVKVMKAVKKFISAEEAKPDFTNRPRDELRKHLVNWIITKAKTI